MFLKSNIISFYYKIKGGIVFMSEIEKNILLIETLRMLENPNVTEELLLG